MDSNGQQVNPENMPFAEDAPAEPRTERVEKQPQAKRLVSLDAFRGLTILGMLLVNNMVLGPATPRLLTHAPWNDEIYFADVVFPWFLFILGVAIPYAMASHRRRGRSFGRYFYKVLERTIMLVLLGMLIDSSVVRQPIVGLGVLQIIGLAYMVAALLYVLPAIWRIILAMVFLLAHWALLRFLPIPGVGAGVLTESINSVSYLNRIYLHPYHLDGIISLAPTSAMALLGTVIGDILRSISYGPRGKFFRVFLAGAVMCALGYLWRIDLPFSKPLWTASFILCTAGAASVVLSILYLVIDVHGRGGWFFPLTILGMNALVAYVVPILVKVYILQGWTYTLPSGEHMHLQEALLQFCRTQAGPIEGGVLYTSLYILFWWFVLLYMYQKRIFMKV